MYIYDFTTLLNMIKTSAYPAFKKAKLTQHVEDVW